jgi:superkiller protein 3
LHQFAKQCFLNPEKHSMPLVAASFALQKCYEMNFKNSNLLNLYGLVLEKQQRIQIAIEMFQEALALLTNQNEKREHLKNAINENLGRCLCRGSRFSESISAFEKIDNGGDSYTLLGLGLAYFFNEQYEESLSVFQKTLSLSEGAKDVQLVNNVNLVLSQVLYALGGTDQIALAKQQLFQW